MTIVRGLTRTDRQMLLAERRDLTDRLARVGTDPTLGILERSAERRAIRERLAEIEQELAA